MWFITFVYKNLVRRPLRSFLTMVAIAIAIGSFLTLVGIATGFESSFLDLYESAGIDIIVVRAGGQQRLNSSLDERLGDKLQKLPGVAQVVGGLTDLVALGESGNILAAVNGWEPGSAAFDHLHIVAGKNMTPQDTRGALLGIILADKME